MSLMASQITSLTIVYSTVYSGADQRKHQSSASLAFVRGIHRGPVNSPHKWPVTWKMFPFDDVIMQKPYVHWWGPRGLRVPGRRQAIIWANTEILWIGPLATNFREILIEIYTFTFKKKKHLKMSSGKWRSFCLGHYVIIVAIVISSLLSSSLALIHIILHKTIIIIIIITIITEKDLLWRLVILHVVSLWLNMSLLKWNWPHSTCPLQPQAMGF